MATILETVTPQSEAQAAAHDAWFRREVDLSIAEADSDSAEWETQSAAKD